MKHLKSYNESIKDYLKPKNKDEINNILKDLSPYKKFKKGCEYGLLDVIVDALIENNEEDPDFIQVGIRIAIRNKDTKILNFLQDIKNNYGRVLKYLKYLKMNDLL